MGCYRNSINKNDTLIGLTACSEWMTDQKVDLLAGHCVIQYAATGRRQSRSLFNTCGKACCHSRPLGKMSTYCFYVRLLTSISFIWSFDLWLIRQFNYLDHLGTQTMMLLALLYHFPLNQCERT